MKYKKELVGLRFGRLLVTEYIGVVRGNHHWSCACECGNIRSVSTTNLNSGRASSCGCRKSEVVIATYTKHGMAGSRTYNIWSNMIRRCSNSKSKDYHNYGGRGISVCKRWLKFESFFADMGVAPIGLSIDRIDNSGDYSKKNCRWATRAEQARNTRNNYYVMYKGNKRVIYDVAIDLGVCSKTAKKMFDRVF